MIGERLGNWIVYKELGRGGMGRVYLAREELTGRLAAVKILAAELAQEGGFLLRFRREIEALSQLEHPNIVRFYESGEENGHYYYAMEYVEGESLDQVLDRDGRLGWKEVLDVALQVCAALKHAHDAGVIHRDLKPANMLRTPDGVVKLADFGIAKVFAATHLTATGGIVGTAEYLSPEQAAGKPATKRSDLYSLGVVLYYLLTGRPPFVGGSPLDLLHKHRYAQFDRPQRYVTDIPPELDEIVCTLLAKDPADRPPDALVLARQVDKLRQKMLRKSELTEAAIPAEPTMTEGAYRAAQAGKEGPATMMSRLVRQELENQNRGGPVRQFFNHPVVLVLGLLVCVGGIAWAFWPPGPQTLFRRGAELMESRYFTDKKLAWDEYLGPLEENYPDHPYREEVKELRRQYEAALAEREEPGASEAQPFVRRGERLLREGDAAGAQAVFTDVVRAFDGIPAERAWVARAEEGLAEIGKAGDDKDPFHSTRQALKRARQLADQGNRREAEAIWDAIADLYRDNPAAAEILAEVKKARGG